MDCDAARLAERRMIEFAAEGIGGGVAFAVEEELCFVGVDACSGSLETE